MSHLIFDIGMHKGEDTDFYLKRGYKVVAVDADINLVQKAQSKLEEYITNDKFTVLNYAISDVDNEIVTFHISKESVWNSLKPEIADRRDNLDKKVNVETRTLPTLFQQYGVPYYCKIDIEGYDNICLQTLIRLEQKPDYISVESECLASDQKILEDESLSTLYSLRELGYSKFKLVDQKTLVPLSLHKKFYHPGIIRALKKLFAKKSQRTLYSDRYDYQFPPGATGPFGEEIDIEWMDFDTAKQTLIRHRKDYYKLSDSLSYGFWCDWHAAK